MKVSLTLSAITGLGWGLIAYFLIGGRFSEGTPWSILSAGAFAGICAGFQTIRSRRKKEGKEGMGATFACYYLGIFSFWLAWFIYERAAMCIADGGWISFDMKDNFKLLGLYLVLGTIPYGLALVPLCFLNRWLVWRAYNWQSS